jgi:hypothetical protein
MRENATQDCDEGLDGETKDMNPKGNPIYVFPTGDFSESLQDCLKDYQEGTIKDAIVIWSRSNGDVCNNWFSDESVLRLIGFIERIKHLIQKYVDEGNSK